MKRPDKDHAEQNAENIKQQVETFPLSLSPAAQRIRATLPWPLRMEAERVQEECDGCGPGKPLTAPLSSIRAYVMQVAQTCVNVKPVHLCLYFIFFL